MHCHHLLLLLLRHTNAIFFIYERRYKFLKSFFFLPCLLVLCTETVCLYVFFNIVIDTYCGHIQRLFGGLLMYIGDLQYSFEFKSFVALAYFPRVIKIKINHWCIIHRRVATRRCIIIHHGMLTQYCIIQQRVTLIIILKLRGV